MAIVIGTVSVKADPLCRRIVREYRERRVRNRVSKDTAARWAEWNKTHPNFHPHPRPKYKLVPEEVMKKVDFACQVPVQPVELTVEIPPLAPDFDFGFAAPPVALAPPPLPSVVEVATAPTPPPPFLPPYSPGLPPGLEPVPEPASWILMLTGGALVCMRMTYIRRRTTESA